MESYIHTTHTTEKRIRREKKRRRGKESGDVQAEQAFDVCVCVAVSKIAGFLFTDSAPLTYCVCMYSQHNK